MDQSAFFVDKTSIFETRTLLYKVPYFKGIILPSEMESPSDSWTARRAEQAEQAEQAEHAVQAEQT